MNDDPAWQASGAEASQHRLHTTPTGTQSTAVLSRRRWFMLVANAVTWLVMLIAVSQVLGAGGWSVIDRVLLVAFAVVLPWTVLGFWNSAVGSWLLKWRHDGLALVAPYEAAGDLAVPLAIDTAVLMTLRNEDPERAIARLAIIKQSLDRTGEGQRFSYFILSDTSRADVAEREEAAVSRWRLGSGGDGVRIFYRRREENTGYKAGNVRDFCQRWGGGFELMLPLDADSMMSGDTILRLVRIMQAHPRLGILQSLVVGMPSESAFARMFQFGMRQGMRPYTMGQAWWSGDCGPFWGHNALVRVKPFVEYCELPVLPGAPPLGGPILSHDQVEATLMRRAGFEVRVLPVEAGSWEENPPTMLDYARRDVRWCQGNLQYLKLLGTPGLKPVSRFQLIWAILMFIGLPAWTVAIALLPQAVLEARLVEDFPRGLAVGLYVVFLVMFVSPKLVGFVDVALSKGGVARYGGMIRFVTGALVEMVFSFLQCAITTFRTSIFMVGLLFGHRVTWGGQARDAYGISWVTAARNFWPETLFGVVVCGVLALIDPWLIVWVAPLALGHLVAIPFARWTALPQVGAAFKRVGLCGIPEDFSAPAELRAVVERNK